jgi:predicted small lipoprotein YifL
MRGARIRSMRSFVGVVASVVFSLVACGGSVEGPAGEPDQTKTDPDDPDESPDDPDDDISPNSIELPECEKGFSATSSKAPCNFLYDDLCYETKTDACACACKTRNTVCSSDFPEPGGRVEVFCE